MEQDNRFVGTHSLLLNLSDEELRQQRELKEAAIQRAREVPSANRTSPP